MTQPPDLIRAVVDRLTPAPLPDRQRIMDGTAPAFPALRQIECGGRVAAAHRGRTVRIGAWNLERCLYPDESARILARAGVDVALLTEMDIGMLRSGQVHTIGRLAASLGHRYAFGVEFVEGHPMPPPPGFSPNGHDNLEGFHGNALTAAVPFADPVAIPLPAVYDWSAPQPAGLIRKEGQRMGIAATFDVGGSRFVACAVHLEYRTDGAGRARQVAALLDRLEAYAGGLPILFGGDLNTPTEAGRDDDPAEPLFALAQARGFDWTACNAGRPTTRTSVWTQGHGTKQLDWFCARGLTVAAPAVIPAIGEDADILSDHELLVLTLTLD